MCNNMCSGCPLAGNCPINSRNFFEQLEDRAQFYEENGHPLVAEAYDHALVDHILEQGAIATGHIVA